MVKLGVNCLDLNVILNKVIVDVGFGEYVGKGFGYGLGLFLYEVLFINILIDYNFEVGNVIIIEFGIYILGYGGVCFEDDIVVIELGFEVFIYVFKLFII